MEGIVCYERGSQLCRKLEKGGKAYLCRLLPVLFSLAVLGCRAVLHLGVRLQTHTAHMLEVALLAETAVSPVKLLADFFATRTKLLRSIGALLVGGGGPATLALLLALFEGHPRQVG